MLKEFIFKSSNDKNESKVKNNPNTYRKLTTKKHHKPTPFERRMAMRKKMKEAMKQEDTLGN